MADLLILHIIAHSLWLVLGVYTLARRERVTKFDYSMCWIVLMVNLASNVIVILNL